MLTVENKYVVENLRRSLLFSTQKNVSGGENGMAEEEGLPSLL